MSDRVKSNSMQDVFHAAGNSANIDFGKYAPKDKTNPLGAREMSEAIQAIADSNYNTGKYKVEYNDDEKEMARNNIDGASNGTEITKEYNETHPITFENVHKICNVSGIIPVNRTGAGDASSENVRNFSSRTTLNLIGWKGTNICGGTAFLQRFLRYVPEAGVNWKEKRLSFASSASTGAGVYLFPYGIFKPNTRYTLILTGYNSSTTSAATNLRFNYTDGTNTTISFPSNAATKRTAVAVSAANKTILSITKYQSSGQTVLYYDECGLFEGVKQASDFEAFNGFYAINDITINDGFNAGGVFDYKLGVFKPYKYYDSYDGETLVGPWLSNIDEYDPDSSPSSGAKVVDLGAYADSIDITNIFPEDIEKATLNIDLTSYVEIQFLGDTNIILAEVMETIKTILADIENLDARVTALENPSETSNSVSPSNSPLNLDQSIIRPDIEISEATIEPNEPTESTDNI